MGKKIVIIKPTRTRINGVDKYDYPDFGKLKTTIVCYNKNDNPPNGDFICEQMYIVEGDDSDIEKLLQDSRVAEIDKTNAIIKGDIWDPPDRYEDQKISNVLSNFKMFYNEVEIPLSNLKAKKLVRGFHSNDWNFDGTM